MAGKVTDRTDHDIGERVRSRRVGVGMTLNALAHTLGISYQQVQKYEKGLNRVSGSRLQRIAEVLGVSVSYFYEGLDPDVPRALSVREEPLMDVLRSREGRKLAQAFATLSPARRKTLIAFLETLD